MLRQPEVYKCRFCGFKVPKAGTMINTYDGSRVPMSVPVSGWSMLQRHCYESHGKEDGVKELLFSDIIPFGEPKEKWSSGHSDLYYILKNIFKHGSIEMEEQWSD